MRPANKAKCGFAGVDGSVSAADNRCDTVHELRTFRIIVYSHCVIAALLPFSAWCDSQSLPLITAALVIPLIIATLASFTTPMILAVLSLAYGLTLWRAGIFVLLDVFLLFVQLGWVSLLCR